MIRLGLGIGLIRIKKSGGSGYVPAWFDFSDPDNSWQTSIFSWI